MAELNEAPACGLGVQKSNDFAVGARLRVPVNQRDAGRVEAVEFGLKVDHRVGYVVQALAALLYEGGNGRIRSGCGKQLDFVASDRKKRGHYPFGCDLFALVGSNSEQPRVEDFGGIEVEHGDSEVLDSEPMG